MKKALSLILALVLCLSLCACGDNENENTEAGTTAEPTTGTTTEPTVETTVETDPLAFLYGFWSRSDRVDAPIELRENGIGSCPSDISWVFSNGILTISGEYMAGSFKHLNSNGFDYLVGEEYTLIRLDDFSAVPKTTIELTVDNWKDYFEIQVNTYENKDQFGDLTGTVTTMTYLKVKESYRLVCGSSVDPISIRFSVDGETIDMQTTKGMIQLNGYLWLVPPENLTIDQIEVIRIEGEITYLDGI